MVHHNKDEDAEHLLTLEATVEIMQEAKKSVPELDPASLEKEESVMLGVCRNKFCSCTHVKDALLESNSEIAEATFDKKWGTGLNVD